MIKVTVHAIGYILEEDLDEESISVRQALEFVSKKNGKDTLEFLSDNMTYLSGGKRVFPDYILKDGDSLTAMAILCGG